VSVHSQHPSLRGMSTAVAASMAMQTPADFGFRSVRPGDFDRIRAIHRDLFPIQYADAFLSNATNGIGLNDSPLFSSIATAKDNDDDIIGFIFCQFIDRGRCEESEALHAQAPASQTCYILTLGIVPQYRRAGLGVVLLNHCLEYAQSNRDCGMVYLHVIDYNLPGIYFYEKHGFVCANEIPGFYNIKGVDYSAFAYIYYMHGNYPPTFLRMYGSIRKHSLSVLNTLRGWVGSIFPAAAAATVSAEYMDGESFRNIRETYKSGPKVQNLELI
jgi:ribosomal protein S18 acetylase RimI-like enzyme